MANQKHWDSQKRADGFPKIKEISADKQPFFVNPKDPVFDRPYAEAGVDKKSTQRVLFIFKH